MEASCKSLPHAKLSEQSRMMFQACESGRLPEVIALLDVGAGSYSGDSESSDNHEHKRLLAALQNPNDGLSPLMVAAKHGHIDICRALLDAGAPWNAIDQYGQCAGNYATNNQHWEVVNLLVEYGTKAELILGASIRLEKKLSAVGEHKAEQETIAKDEKASIPVSHEPCTKPDYLQHNVRYNPTNTLLLDDDDDAVMMEWERPLMNAHASILTSNTHGKRVLNVGFGLGIIDNALQECKPTSHVIIEAHPVVYDKMIKDGWDKKPGVRICFGRWQDELPNLIDEGLIFDGIFYDTYGEHFTDLEDFHELVAKALHKPDGIYSFFNGLAPDNLFFHGVACNCVKIQLSHLGLDAEFASCEIQVNEKDWEGVRRKYWHGRDTYYLPIVTWKKK
mmetsp:Transcript_14524/g.29712  ORF Transcript_14524/g.29712 Transcript_14524/m.29712 type:complete len:392 (-) Transcript_14524:182-1357(-)